MWCVTFNIYIQHVDFFLFFKKLCVALFVEKITIRLLTHEQLKGAVLFAAGEGVCSVDINLQRMKRLSGLHCT
jgi:hypothetical protein